MGEALPKVVLPNVIRLGSPLGAGHRGFWGASLGGGLSGLTCTAMGVWARLCSVESRCLRGGRQRLRSSVQVLCFPEAPSPRQAHFQLPDCHIVSTQIRASCRPVICVVLCGSPALRGGGLDTWEHALGASPCLFTVAVSILCGHAAQRVTGYVQKAP